MTAVIDLYGANSEETLPCPPIPVQDSLPSSRPRGRRRLVTAYYSEHPDPSVADQRVSFGTSGHRGSCLRVSFNDDHIAATTQAICDYRAQSGTGGPLFLARDTHALSEPAWVTAVEVLAADDVTVLIDARDAYTPTPALSHADPVVQPRELARRRRRGRDRRHSIAQPTI